MCSSRVGDVPEHVRFGPIVGRRVPIPNDAPPPRARDTVRGVVDWSVERSTGSAAEFHARDITDVASPTVWIHRVTRRALVLGSSQRADVVDLDAAERLDVEVCGRRSGGGLVLIEPDRSCWIDVLVQPDGGLWDDDVNRAFRWVGEVWRSALASLAVADLRVHDGPLLHPEAGRFLCFAGLGPGEVVQVQERPGHDVEVASKVVGLSQRRQRGVARFQGLFVSATDPVLTRSLVLRDAWPDGLDPSRVPVGTREEVDLDLLADRFLEALPDPAAT